MCRESGLGVEKQLVFTSKRKGRRKAYSNFSFCVAQRRTEFAVSWSTTNSTSLWPVDGFPTWIAKISGSWESDEFGGADDGVSCRVNAGKPIAEVGGTALLRSVLATSPDGKGICSGGGSYMVKGDPFASGIKVGMGGDGALSSLFWSCVTVRMEG